MWRMTLVAVFAAAVYFAVPLAAPGPPDPPTAADAGTFGKPWTIDSLAKALRTSGLTVDLGTVARTSDPRPEWPGSGLIVGGTLDGDGAVIVVYRSVAVRRSIWKGHPSDDNVRSPQRFGIPEIRAIGLDNAVVVLDMSSRNLFSAVGALRHD